MRSASAIGSTGVPATCSRKIAAAQTSAAKNGAISARTDVGSSSAGRRPHKSRSSPRAAPLAIALSARSTQ
jgi:hypothetical protein